MYDQGLIDSQTGASNRQSNLEKEVEQLKKKIEEIEKRLKLVEKLYQKSIQSLLTKKKIIKMEITKTIIFLVSFYLTIYFLGKLFSWGVYKLCNNHKSMSNKQILIANICMFIAGLGWATLYYLSL